MVEFGIGFPWELREYPVPDPEPGAIVTHITMASVCGTDVHLYKGDFGGRSQERRKPSIPGHEFVGRVHKLGRGVTADSAGRHLAEGDRVVWSPSIVCGRCPACLRGVLPCPNRKSHIGTTSDEWPHFKGGFADYYYVSPGQWIYRVPDSVPDAAAVYVGCAAATVAYALSKVCFSMGSWGVIQGAGGLGLCAAPMMKDLGARVIIIDKVARRLDLARAFGADETIGYDEFPEPECRINRVKELVGGRGAEVVLEVVAAAPEVVAEGLEMLDYGGTYLTVGLVGPYRVDLNMMPFIDRGLSLIGSAQFNIATMPAVLDLMARTMDKYPWASMISHTLPLQHGEQAIQEAVAGQMLRVAVTTE
jgi:threonine dehydrogenase-like Zn-dependent dehydrogenase